MMQWWRPLPASKSTPLCFATFFCGHEEYVHENSVLYFMSSKQSRDTSPERPAAVLCITRTWVKR
jgi:hypothetical protein